MRSSSLEDRVRRYIKMKKFFMFGDALMITGLTKDTLMSILENFEALGLIVKDRDEKSLMSSSFVVLSNRRKRVVKDEDVRVDMELVITTKKLLQKIKKIEGDRFCYLQLLRSSTLSKGVFARAVRVLINLKILKEIETDRLSKDDRVFELDRVLFDTLLTFYKQKKYKEIQEILDSKRALSYVTVPKDLIQVLDVIVQNEALKRDELAHMAKVTRRVLSSWWQVLKKVGVVVDSFKESEKERVTYIFSSKKAKSTLAYINSGGYESDREFKRLWEC